ISAHEMDLLPWLQVELAETALGDGQLAQLTADRPALRDLPGHCDELCVGIAEALSRPDLSESVRESLRSLKDRAERAADGARALIRTAEVLIARSRRWQRETDFGFLYDPERHLLHLGYNVTVGELDPNYYDLLASEARLASYVAVAKRDVPENHWLHLGRPFVRIGAKRGLASWSATAFEYFMPHLLMAAPPESLLAESCYVAAEEQQAFARRMNIPWGVSESGFYQLDKQAHYQYRAFGIPGLGLRPEGSYRLVIAPYASVLALPFTPRAVIANLEALEAFNMVGRYGLYEAVDFGTAAPGEQRRGQIVRSYMSHHQGMILAALNNALNEAVLVRRFHAEPRIAGHVHLLHEQVPRGSADAIGWRGPEPERPAARRLPRLETWGVPGHRNRGQLNVLANGHYQVLLSEGGMWTSSWNGLCLGRWQPGPCEPQGTCTFVKDLEAGTLWSAGSRPIAPSDPADVHVRFAPHMAEFHRRDHGVHLTTTIAVAGDDDVEIQRLAVTNNTDRARRLLLVSYREPVLAPLADYERHPAFAKMFVEILATPEDGLLIARRRPREAGETPLYVGLAAAEFGGCLKHRQVYSDRRAFLGRNGSLVRPEILAGEPPAGEVPDAASLDPLMAAGIEIELTPRGSTELVFLFAAAHSRAEVLELTERYRSLPRIEWAFQRARQRSERVLAELEMTSDEVRQVLALLSGVLRADPRLRAWQLAANAPAALQPVLWSRGISGDLPLLLLHVRGPDDLRTAEQLVRMHAYWDRHQIAVDLVLLDSEIGGYAQPTRTRLSRIVEDFRDRRRHYTQGSIYIVPAAELSPDDRHCLLAAAWLVVDDDQGNLMTQLDRLEREPPHLPAFVPVPSSPVIPEPTPALERPELLHDNGFGGFTADGREYVIFLEPGVRTPAPWYNVIANPTFGFVVGESGTMCSWAENSGERRLTPWRNDPVQDPTGESLYLRDEETGVVWSPTPQPAPDARPYEIRHGAGHTTFRHISEGLDQEICVFADPVDPVKIIRITLRNCWQRPRRITISCCAEWVLGPHRGRTRPYLLPAYDAGRNALLVRNGFTRERGRTAFLAASEPLHGFTTDRVEFFGTTGDHSAPAALQRVGLTDTIAPVAEPCAALQVHVDLETAGTSTMHFLLGEGDDADHATALVDGYGSGEACDASWARVQAFWDDHLGALSVDTPDSALNVMVNRWLLYQALACRLWGRT
ncbi:MAG: glucoamylase family protein, partial [Gammaproteobacteria bacterium]